MDEYTKAGDPTTYKPGDQEGKTWYRKDRGGHDEKPSKKSDHKASSHEEENEDTTGCTTLVINGLFTIGELELWSSLHYEDNDGNKGNIFDENLFKENIVHGVNLQDIAIRGHLREVHSFHSETWRSRRSVGDYGMGWRSSTRRRM